MAAELVIKIRDQREREKGRDNLTYFDIDDMLRFFGNLSEMFITISRNLVERSEVHYVLTQLWKFLRKKKPKEKQKGS